VNRLLRCAMVIAITLLEACESGEAQRARVEKVDNYHGFHAGDSVPPTMVRCASGRTRTVGAVGALQLITLSTPGDCSSCLAHLAGLEAIARNYRAAGDDYVVAWSPGASLSGIQRTYAITPSRDVCLDSAGALWDRLDIQHTPVSVVLSSGRIVYMTDKALSSEASQARLMADLASVGFPFFRR